MSETQIEDTPYPDALKNLVTAYNEKDKDRFSAAFPRTIMFSDIGAVPIKQLEMQLRHRFHSIAQTMPYMGVISCEDVCKNVTEAHIVFFNSPDDGKAITREELWHISTNDDGSQIEALSRIPNNKKNTGHKTSAEYQRAMKTILSYVSVSEPEIEEQPELATT